jgi:hypothetical protein
MPSLILDPIERTNTTRASTMRANRAIRPNEPFKLIKSRLLIVEIKLV